MVRKNVFFLAFCTKYWSSSIWVRILSNSPSSSWFLFASFNCCLKVLGSLSNSSIIVWISYFVCLLDVSILWFVFELVVFSCISPLVSWLPSTINNSKRFQCHSYFVTKFSYNGSVLFLFFRSLWKIEVSQQPFSIHGITCLIVVGLWTCPPPSLLFPLFRICPLFWALALPLP